MGKEKRILIVSLSIGLSIALCIVLIGSCTKKIIKTQQMPLGKNCYYHVRDPNSQKTITCTTVIAQEQCGLFLKDCDSGVSGVTCATNTIYYCR